MSAQTREWATRNGPRRGSWAPLLLGLAVVSGCAIGPNYRRPAVETPERFREEATSSATASTALADLPWWDVFQDPTLKALVEEALANNFDLRRAAVRVEQARYDVGVTRADLLPRLGYEGRAERRQANEITSNRFLGALQMAWEIDVWGRIRRATEASFARLVAAEDVRRGVVLSLVTTVAQAYFELRELDLELEIARRTRASFEETHALFTRQLTGGVGNKLATSRAAGAEASTAALIPELERQIVVKENQISLLLGRAPVSIPRGQILTEQSLPPEVPAGLPAALLERRPDILRAEQDIVAANALVGVSLASFLPRIGLTTLYGGQSSELENLLDDAAKVWSVGGSLLGPIFQGGQLYYTYKSNVAAWEEARLAYEQTVVGALGEVSNALVARRKLALARRDLERQVAALQEAVRLAYLRFHGGFASYFEVLQAQQELFPAENALARNRLGELVAVVQLYRALGGGWRSEEERAPARYPMRREALDRLLPGTATGEEP